MNRDSVYGEPRQQSGKVKQKWGQLTDADLKQAEGRRENILGRLLEKHGLAKERTRLELKSFGID